MSFLLTTRPVQGKQSIASIVDEWWRECRENCHQMVVSRRVLQLHSLYFKLPRKNNRIVVLTFVIYAGESLVTLMDRQTVVVCFENKGGWDEQEVGTKYIWGVRAELKNYSKSRRIILLSISLNISSPSSSPSLFCYLSSHHLTMVQLSTLIISQSGWIDGQMDEWTFEYQVDRLFSRKRHIARHPSTMSWQSATFNANNKIYLAWKRRA